MKKHNPIQALALCLCLLLGLSAPFLSILIQDGHPSSHHAFEDTAHYTYRGTLLNRVLAMGAHLNRSPALKEVSREEGAYPKALALWTELSDFLPISGKYDLFCQYITLAPKQYHAQYRYVSLTYRQENLTLQALVDEESGLPIRIELKCPPEVLNTFFDGRSASDPIRCYADLLAVGAPADLFYSESAVLWGFSTPLRGVPYTAEMTVLPSGGILLLQLTAVSE